MSSIVITFFLVDDKDEKSWFFEETFLLANINMNIALRILFLTLSIIEVNFTNREFKWKSYTIVKAFPTTKQVELVRNKEFAAAALNLDNKIFIVRLVLFADSVLSLAVYLFW